MSARYGRNKRRAAREAIAALTAESERFKREAAAASRALATAREDGATEALRHQHLKPAIDMLMRRLAEGVRPELLREAQRILDARARQGRNPSPLDMRASFDPMDATVMRIDVRVPEMRAGIHVMDW